MDAGSLLKPLLARGAALHRRHYAPRVQAIHPREGQDPGPGFQWCNSPQWGDTISLLREPQGGNYEIHHGVHHRQRSSGRRHLSYRYI
jgi:hypothetical protein